MLGPVFQGSRLRSNVDLAEARLNEAAAAYGRSVVSAVNEVEAALAGLEASRRRHSLLASRAQEAQAETALQERRYVSGVDDYEDFLTATYTLLGAHYFTLEVSPANYKLRFSPLPSMKPSKKLKFHIAEQRRELRA